MVNVVTEILIDKPIEVVSAYAANPDNAPEWYVNIKSAVWETEKPLRQGSKIAFTAQFLGKQIAYTYEFTEIVPKQKLVMRTSQGPFPMETTYTWISLGENKTKMILQNKGEPSGFSKIFTPFMSMMMRIANTKDLIKIKKILEKNYDKMEFNGQCAFAVSTGKTAIAGGKHTATIHGKTYAFSNPVAKLLFKLLPNRIKKAETVWSKIN